MRRPPLPHLVPALLLTMLVTLLSGGCGSKSSGPTAPTGPSCQLTPTSLEFGHVTVGTADTLTFTVKNVGGGTLSGALSLSCADFSIVGPSSYSLAAGQVASFKIRFEPASAASSSCTLQTGCATVPLHGDGQAPPYEVLPSAVNFGRAAPNELYGFAILNHGSSTLSGTVTSPCPTFVLVNDLTHDVSSLPYSIAPGTTFNVALSFRPTSGGAQSCAIQTGLPLIPQVECTGVGQGCNVSPASVDLGSPWHWFERQITISNPDSVRLQGQLQPQYGPFAVLGSNSFDLGLGESATFTVAVVPNQAASGQRYTAPIATGLPTCAEVSATVQGPAVDPIFGTGCAVATVELVDFGTLHVGEMVSRAFGVTTSGSCQGQVDEFSSDLQLTSASFDLGPGITQTVTATFTASRLGRQHVLMRVLSMPDNTYPTAVSDYVEGVVIVVP